METKITKEREREREKEKERERVIEAILDTVSPCSTYPHFLLLSNLTKRKRRGKRKRRKRNGRGEKRCPSADAQVTHTYL